MRSKSVALCSLAPLATALSIAGHASARGRGYETIQVPKDQPVFVVPGDTGKRSVIVYLHGRCGDPLAGINAFPEASSQRGTMISVQADEPCPNNPQRRRWGADLRAIQTRIDAAISAVAAQREGGLDTSELTLIGYSEGALRAEQIAKKYPSRYPRVVVIGSPVTPSATSFANVKAVITMVGELDRQDLMRAGYADIEKSGKPVRFMQLPGVGHGKYGADGNRVLDEAFTWLFQQAP